MDRFAAIVRDLRNSDVGFVVIGVAGVNYYAHTGAVVFTTQDRDLFLPPDPHNLLGAWRACESAGLELFAGAEPLDLPRDLVLARSVVDRRALTRASDGQGLDLDLSLVMTGFETVYHARRTFVVDGIDIPVARLTHIVESKSQAGRPKDRLFLATHRDALRQMLGEDV